VGRGLFSLAEPKRARPAFENIANRMPWRDPGRNPIRRNGPGHGERQAFQGFFVPCAGRGTGRISFVNQFPTVGRFVDTIWHGCPGTDGFFCEGGLVLSISSLEWIRRCAVRITEIDKDVDRAEARSIALALHDFERTRALEPERAVEFVAAELVQPHPVFERRSAPR
jgi:hypothetical protein